MNQLVAEKLRLGIWTIQVQVGQQLLSRVVGQPTDEERAIITNAIDALVTKAKLRLITGGAG